MPYRDSLSALLERIELLERESLAARGRRRRITAGRRRRARPVTFRIALLVTLSLLAATLGVTTFVRAVVAAHAAARSTSLVSARTLQRAAERLCSESTCCDGVVTVPMLIQARYVDEAARSGDAWGGPFEISIEEDTMVVRSPGPDRVLGTADDLEVR